jgi:hypothetical protein
LEREAQGRCPAGRHPGGGSRPSAGGGLDGHEADLGLEPEAGGDGQELVKAPSVDVAGAKLGAHFLEFLPAILEPDTSV